MPYVENCTDTDLQQKSDIGLHIKLLEQELQKEGEKYEWLWLKNNGFITNVAVENLSTEDKDEILILAKNAAVASDVAHAISNLAVKIVNAHRLPVPRNDVVEMDKTVRTSNDLYVKQYDERVYALLEIVNQRIQELLSKVRVTKGM